MVYGKSPRSMEIVVLAFLDYVIQHGIAPTTANGYLKAIIKAVDNAGRKEADLALPPLNSWWSLSTLPCCLETTSL